MPIAKIQLPDGRIAKFEVPEGTTPEQVTAFAEQQFKAPAAEGFGERVNREIAAIPRQIGMTARHGLRGVGNLVGLAADPIGGVINAATGSKLQTARSLADSAADYLGLPKPETATERVVGDVTELMATGGGMAGTAAKAANTVQGGTRTALQALATNPMQQTVSAGASGAAGGYTRETGGNDAAQFLASLVAGVATPLAMSKGQQLGTTVGNTAKTRLTPQPELTAQVDMQIANALQQSGVTLADLPVHVRNGMRTDVQQAMGSQGVLSPDAIRRLADYRLTGATPTAATLTLDPAMVSRQKNLAKLGINSKDAAAQQLGQVENANNRQLIEGMNAVGANTPDDALAAGQKVIGALDSRISSAKSKINARYEAARASNGRSAALDPSHFTQTANNLLDDALLGGKLPGDVRNLLNKTAKGEMPLTVDVAEQFKTRIGELQRTTIDKAERKALGLVRQALDDTPLLDGQGAEAIKAFNKARRLNRAWMQIVEKTPALQAVRDGVEPDKFVQTFIVGNGSNANTADLAMLKRAVANQPEAQKAIKTQIAAHLKNSALNNAADEVGNFSQSSYNKALKAIGDRKLAMFFSPDEVAQIKAIGRVASYEQFQPKGSAVNNSNTAGAALSTIFDRIADSPFLSKIPLGSHLAGPAQNISVGIKSKQAMNIPRSLTTPRLPGSRPPAGLLMSPAMFVQMDEDERRGLLAP